MKLRAWLIPATILVLASQCQAELKPRTTASFDHYLEQAESRIRQEQSSPASFLRLESLAQMARAQAESRLRRGEILIDRIGDPAMQIPGGLIHHWVGTAFIPGVTLAETMALVQDYHHHSRHYSPEVLRSKLLSRSGDDFRIALRLQKRKVITVVLDTEYDIRYGGLDNAHLYSVSRSTRILEVANPGQRDEHVMPEAHDRGFLWRLNTYWRFVQATDGVFLQCEAISLTRDVPTGLGWMIGPFIQEIPRESLQFTLSATRDAVLSRAMARTECESCPGDARNQN